MRRWSLTLTLYPKYMNWQDQLASLRSSLPEGDAPAHAPESETSIPVQHLHIRYERKGRAGKPATIIGGFTLPSERMAELAADLKKSIGVGGSWRDDEILLQGDCREAAARLLRSHSHKVK